jgi:hypothetical protein
MLPRSGKKGHWMLLQRGSSAEASPAQFPDFLKLLTMESGRYEANLEGEVIWTDQRISTSKPSLTH